MLYVWRDPTARFRNHGKFAPIEPKDDAEKLSGWVLGKEASDLEERFYNAFRKDTRVRTTFFRRIFGAAARNLAGAIELDFLIFAGAVYAVQIDAERFHLSAKAIARDMQQDGKLLRILARYNVHHIHRVRQRHLANPDKAARVWEQLLSGRRYTKWS